MTPIVAELPCGEGSAVNILEALDDPHPVRATFPWQVLGGLKIFSAALFCLAGSGWCAPEGFMAPVTGRSGKPPGAAYSREAALMSVRRGGKSRILALVAVYLPVFRDYSPHLAAGELRRLWCSRRTGHRREASSGLFRVLLKAVPLFGGWSWTKTPKRSRSSNRVVIEIGTA